MWRSGLYSDCLTNYDLTQANDPSDPNYTGVQYYEASNSVTSTRQVVGGFGTDVRYQAGSYIELKPGFVTEEGNIFEAVLGPCGN